MPVEGARCLVDGHLAESARNDGAQRGIARVDPVGREIALADAGKKPDRDRILVEIDLLHRQLDAVGECVGRGAQQVGFTNAHDGAGFAEIAIGPALCRSEEHTSELQSLMRNPYAVFFLKKKKTITTTYSIYYTTMNNKQ